MLTARSATAPVPGLANWKAFTPARANRESRSRRHRQGDGLGDGDRRLVRQSRRGTKARARAERVRRREHGRRPQVRFGLFAVLPLPDVDAPARDRVRDGYAQADGVGLLTSFGNQCSATRRSRRLFDELNRRRAVVLRASTDAAAVRIYARVAAQMLDTRPIPLARRRLVAGGTASSDADIRYVFSHAGGTLTGGGRPVSRGSGRRGVAGETGGAGLALHHLRRFYYDTAGAANRSTCRS